MKTVSWLQKHRTEPFPLRLLCHRPSFYGSPRVCTWRKLAWKLKKKVEEEDQAQQEEERES